VAFKPLHIPDLTREILSMVKQTFPKTITFQELYASDIPDILADRTQIHQAILNLCVNARDAMPTGGLITIRIGCKTRQQVLGRFPSAEYDQYISIDVIDTGTGIDPHVRQRIFDPFYTTKEVGKGTGLGLSVVYGIMEAHHGFVDVESQVGIGTTFSLLLPVEQQEQLFPSSEVLTVEQAGGTETILIVEDEEMLLEMLRALLESKGYTVISASDGLEAIQVYSERQSDIDLVITDIGLPKLDGISEFWKLKAINPLVKVVLASGFLDPEMKAKLHQAGTRGFVQKPYLPEQILIKIREILDHSKVVS